jgi:hypothetical protein
MKTKFFTAFVAVFTMMVLTSCEDSSFVGFNSVEMQSVPTSYKTEEVEKTLPEFWGKVIGIGISAVPADDVRGSYAKKCMVIRCEHGAVVVTFDMEQILPDEEAISTGYFIEGNFGLEYNGGVYISDHWEPAISKDLSDRIAYYQDDTCKRNLRNSTLKCWNWRNGNWSTVIEGYSFVVDGNGAISISYEGELYMVLR